MKIKRLYTLHYLVSKVKTTFDSSAHKIEYVKEMNGYLIDGVSFVPSSGVKEILIEQEPKEKK